MSTPVEVSSDASRARSLATVPVQAALIVFSVVVVRLVTGPLIIDDAYITYRYARNLAGGAGLVFNPGERVMGSSSPLLLLLLAGSHALGLDIPMVSFLLGILSDVLTSLLLLGLGRAVSHPAAGVVASLAFALAPKSVLPAVSGMETPLYSALVFGAFAFLAFRRPRAAALSAGLAAVARPEGASAALLLLAGFLFVRRRIRLSEILLAVAPLAVWIVFSQAYFGTWVPHSVTAKASVYPAFENPFHDAVLIGNYLTAPFEWLADVPKIGLLNALFGWALALGVIRAGRRQLAAGLLGGWALAIALGYAILNRYLFPWYLAPLFPIALFFTSVGIEEVIAIIRQRTGHLRGNRLWRPAIVVLGALVLAAMAVGLLAATLGLRRDIAIRETAYLQSGRWIEAELGVAPTVAAVEIGALGFAYPGRITDLTGLVTPASLPFYSRGDYSFIFPHDVPPDMVAAFRPPILVVFDGFIGSLLESPFFARDYCLARQSSEEHRVYGTLQIYVLRQWTMDLDSDCEPVARRNPLDG